jgi:hypothetical protein
MKIVFVGLWLLQKSPFSGEPSVKKDKRFIVPGEFDKNILCVHILLNFT